MTRKLEIDKEQIKKGKRGGANKGLFFFPLSLCMQAKVIGWRLVWDFRKSNWSAENPL